MPAATPVLAATDLSVAASHAVERAARLAHEQGTALALLHVIAASPLEQLRRHLVDVPPQVLEEPAERLHALAESLRTRHGIPVEAHVVAGRVLEELERRIAALRPWVVAVGSDGASPVRSRLLGSTAERAASRIAAPVLIVKEPPQEPYRKVLVAVDLAARSVDVVRCAQAVAPDADTLVLHVAEAPFEGKLRQAGVATEHLRDYRSAVLQDAEDTLRSLRQATGGATAAATYTALPGHVLDGILEQQREIGADLLVFGRQGEGRVEELLLGSVARRLLVEAPCDVLVAA